MPFLEPSKKSWAFNIGRHCLGTHLHPCYASQSVCQQYCEPCMTWHWHPLPTKLEKTQIKWKPRIKGKLFKSPNRLL